MKYRIIKIPDDINLPVVKVEEGETTLPISKLIVQMRKKHKELNVRYRLSYDNGAAMIFSTSKEEEEEKVVSRDGILQEAIDVVDEVLATARDRSSIIII